MLKENKKMKANMKKEEKILIQILMKKFLGQRKMKMKIIKITQILRIKTKEFPKLKILPKKMP